MKTIAVVLLAASSCQAALLSHLELRNDQPAIPVTTNLMFSLASSGIGSVVSVVSDADTRYYAIDQEVEGMYGKVSHPSEAQQHDPLLANLFIGDLNTVNTPPTNWALWSGYYTLLGEPNYTLLPTDHDAAGNTIGGYLTVNGTPAVLTTPWKTVTIERTAWQLIGGKYSSTVSVNIYDTLVPEPPMALLVTGVLTAFVITGRRS